MCGIAGIIRFDGQRHDEPLLRRMVAQLHHRGPEETGFYTNCQAALGHSRLSIIDLSRGQQPMTNENETLWVTFNGEIFNYRELRRDLEYKGHVFSTDCDTEVILHSYEQYGKDCVEQFNGQWSFAIWDTQRSELFASRDRLGVRPFFYTDVGANLLFASEIKALFCDERVKRKFDLEAIDQILTLWHPIPPKTAFAGIWQLPPGHNMLVNATGRQIWRWWTPQYEVDQPPLEEREYADQLRHLLIDATRLRLRADVPVGAYLSGGLDSSVITGLIKKYTDTPLKTFSVAFTDKEFDESGYQREVVNQLGTDHYVLQCDSSDIGRIFPEVIRQTEKPILRTAPAPLYLLSGMVRDHGYKVVLTGEGSDEILGGYDIYKEAKVRRFWAAMPQSRRRAQMLKQLYPYMPALQNQPEAYLKAFFRVGERELADPLFSHLPRWELTSRLKMLYSDTLRERLSGYDTLEQLRQQLPSNFSNWHPFHRAQYLETIYLLPGYILSSQGDRMSMGHSVEGRFPFLDHRVVEWAGRLPPRMKMRGLDEKHILKRAAAGLVPPAVLKRPKQPYRAPDAASFFTSEPEYLEDILCDRAIRQAGIFNPAAVKMLVNKARSGAALGVKDNMAVVGVISTQLLHQLYLQ